MELSGFLIIIDLIVFAVFALSVCYLLVYALASTKKCYVEYSKSRKLYRILVLFPAYKEDSVIVNSVNSFLNQEYPSNQFDVVVISDNMSRETNELLRSLPIKVFEAGYQNSTKAKSLKFAIESIGDYIYDIVVIMDADNTAEPDFLSKICNAYYSGSKAIQSHRVAKNLNTDTAILDAISEEINNSIFRRGHVNLGVSSALIGSGMAFDFLWFKENVMKISSLPEERELEVLLLRQGIFIDYLEDVKVFDEKTQKDSVFYKQRRRWLASQFDMLKSVLKELPAALFSLNISFADKIIQWLMLPRVIILGLLFFIAIIVTFINLVYALKWWVLLVAFLFSVIVAIPDYLINKRVMKALKRVPLLFIMMFFNLFNLKNTNKNFIHTEKNFK